MSAVSVAQVRHVIYKIALPWQTLSILHLLWSTSEVLELAWSMLELSWPWAKTAGLKGPQEASWSDLPAGTPPQPRAALAQKVSSLAAGHSRFLQIVASSNNVIFMTSFLSQKFQENVRDFDFVVWKEHRYVEYLLGCKEYISFFWKFKVKVVDLWEISILLHLLL